MVAEEIEEYHVGGSDNTGVDATIQLCKVDLSYVLGEGGTTPQDTFSLPRGPIRRIFSLPGREVVIPHITLTRKQLLHYIYLSLPKDVEAFKEAIWNEEEGKIEGVNLNEKSIYVKQSLNDLFSYLPDQDIAIHFTTKQNNEGGRGKNIEFEIEDPSDPIRNIGIKKRNKKKQRLKDRQDAKQRYEYFFKRNEDKSYHITKIRPDGSIQNYQSSSIDLIFRDSSYNQPNISFLPNGDVEKKYLGPVRTGVVQ